MDTKTQNLPITYTQAHSNARPQNHSCNLCNCCHHCQNCSHSCSWSRSCSRSQSCSRSRSSSQSPGSHCGPPGHQSQSLSPRPPQKHQRRTMHSPHCPMRPIGHSCSYPKNRKNLERKMNRRKVVKRSQRVYKTKRRSSGRKYN